MPCRGQTNASSLDWLPADAIVCKAEGQGRCLYDHTSWTADSNVEMVEAIKADPSIIH